MGDQWHHLELPGVHAIVALDERVPQIVDAEAFQALQSAVVKVQIVWVPHVGFRALSQLLTV